MAPGALLSALNELNSAPVEEAAGRVLACHASRRWVDSAVAGRPEQRAEITQLLLERLRTE
jgi:hypothetical protein